MYDAPVPAYQETLIRRHVLHGLSMSYKKDTKLIFTTFSYTGDLYMETLANSLKTGNVISLISQTVQKYRYLKIC